MAVNPYRGQLWLLAAEVAVIAMLGTLADAGHARATVAVLLALWLIFLATHGKELQDVFAALGRGEAVATAPPPTASVANTGLLRPGPR